MQGGVGSGQFEQSLHLLCSFLLLLYQLHLRSSAHILEVGGCYGYDLGLSLKEQIVINHCEIGTGDEI